MISVSAWAEKDGTWVATWKHCGHVVVFSPFPEDGSATRNVVRAATREDAFRDGEAAAYREIAAEFRSRAEKIEEKYGAVQPVEMCFACCPYHAKSNPCRRFGK